MVNEEIINLIPGFIQGITRVTISYPFDVIKVNMQKMIYSNIKQSLLTIYKTDPYKFYRGSSLCYFTVGIERSIQYSFIEKMNNKKINPYVSGLIMSIFSSIYQIPVQYLTTNIAIKNNKIDLKKYIIDIFKNKTNLYKGYFIETPKNILGSTIFLGSYYTLRNKFGENNNLAPLYGAISGTIVWIITFPIDTIRTEYQTSEKSIKNIINERIKKYGIKSFYNGLSPILLRTIPSASIGMFMYEYSRNIVKKHLKDN